MCSGIGVAVLGHLRLEASARHAERLHARRDLARQGTRCARAPPGERTRLLGVVLQRGGELLAQRRQVEIGTLERLQLRLQQLQALAEILGRNAVLAGQILDRRQTALDLVLARRIDVERIAVALQLARRLADLDHRFLERRQQRGELAVERRESAQRLQRAGDTRMGARRLVLVQLPERSLRACGEAAAVREAPPLLGQTGRPRPP